MGSLKPAAFAIRCNIDIAIDDIKNAPKTRVMNLRAIRHLGIFTVNLKNPQLIYIDDVRLIGPKQ